MAGEWKGDVKWMVSLLIIALLGLAGWVSTDWSCPISGNAANVGSTCAGSSGTESTAGIASLILSGSPAGAGSEAGLVVLLQLLGIVLVAALIGALVIAIREDLHKEGA